MINLLESTPMLLAYRRFIRGFKAKAIDAMINRNRV